MVFVIVVGVVFLVVAVILAIASFDNDSPLLMSVVLIVFGGIFIGIGFYKDGQQNKTPASLKGQCVANVQVTQYPGRNISGEAQKLRVLLYHNGKCSGSLTLKSATPAP